MGEFTLTEIMSRQRQDEIAAEKSDVFSDLIAVCLIFAILLVAAPLFAITLLGKGLLFPVRVFRKGRRPNGICNNASLMNS